MTLSVVAGACGDDGSDGEEAEDSASEEAADTTETTETTDTTDTTEEGDDEASWDDVMAEYTGCLEGQGFEMGDIPEGIDLQALEEASPEVQLEMGLEPGVVEAHGECWTAVEDALAAGVSPPEAPSAPPTTVDAELAQQMTDAVACLNTRGWDFLEPGVEAGPLEMAPREADFDWDDPGFLQDQRECQQQAGVFVP